MPVLWLGVVGPLWALGAWLLFATMGGVRDEMLLGAVVRVALVVALVAGTAASRRSRPSSPHLQGAAAGLSLTSSRRAPRTARGVLCAGMGRAPGDRGPVEHDWVRGGTGRR